MILVKITPNKEKAKSLLNFAIKTLCMLKENPMINYPSCKILQYYIIIHSIVQGIITLEGYKTSGTGAHIELIKELTKKYQIKDKHLIYQLREIRNDISYNGHLINFNYLKQNEEKILNLIKSLKKIISKKLQDIHTI